MTPGNLLAVAIVVMGLWYFCAAVIAIFVGAIGPFAYLIVGIALIIVGWLVLNRRSGG